MGKEARLEEYRWCSYPTYLRMGLRTKWLRVERVMGEHGLQEDTVATWNEFSKRVDEKELKQLPKRWPIKVSLAKILREHTSMSMKWIATRLHIGS